MLRMSPRSLMRWGCALAGLGNAALMVAPDYGTVVFAYALASLGFGFARPGFTAGASLAAPAGSQGAVAGALTAVIGASFVVAPVAAVALYEWIGPTPFAVNALAALALLFYAMRSPTLRRAKLVTEPTPALD
jgi:MFS family permease